MSLSRRAAHENSRHEPFAGTSSGARCSRSRRRSIARSLYQRNIEVRIKADKSPVTEADVRCEMAIREILEARFPGYGFLRRGDRRAAADAENLWLVDPDRRHQGVRARVPDVLDPDRADARAAKSCSACRARRCTANSPTPNAARGAYLNGKRDRGERDSDARRGGAVRRATLKSLAVGRAMAAIRRAGRARRPHPRLRRFSALSSARGGQDRRRDRDRREHSRHRGVRGDRDRGGGPFTDLDGAPITLGSTTVLATNGPLHPPSCRRLRRLGAGITRGCGAAPVAMVAAAASESRARWRGPIDDFVQIVGLFPRVAASMRRPAISSANRWG